MIRLSDSTLIPVVDPRNKWYTLFSSTPGTPLRPYEGRWSFDHSRREFMIENLPKPLRFYTESLEIIRQKCQL